MVQPDSRRISRVPRYLGVPARARPVSSTGLSPTLVAFSKSIRLQTWLLTLLETYSPLRRIPLHRRHNACRLTCRSVWAVSRSLAATEEIVITFFSWGYLDVSILPVCFRCPIYSGRDDTALPVPGFPIRRSPGLRLFAPIRGFSQLTTSFIAFTCRGIHHMLLVA